MENGFDAPPTPPSDGEKRTLVERAIEQWKRQLFEFGASNNLLFYRDLKKGTLSLDEDDGINGERLQTLLRGGVVRLTDLFPGTERDDAIARVRRIQDRTRAIEEERGLQTLSLAHGLATWPDATHSRNPMAPVLLRGLSLKSTGKAEGDFELVATGDWEINPSLLQLLDVEYGVEISDDDLEDLIDRTEKGALPTVLSRFKALCSGIPKFDVISRTVVGNFSHAKSEMIKDLDEGIDLLLESSVIMAVAGDDEARTALRDRFPSTDVSDPDRMTPLDEFLVLDADSSQSFVINAAVAGADLVVQGPPGTGKSQTIANLIASLSARGKSVLFVAEKRAAIEAVVNRLRNTGLADLVFDLHESGSSKTAFRKQIEQALAAVSMTPAVDVAEDVQRLVQRRQLLVERTAAMAEVRQPWGRSAIKLLEELPEALLSERTALRVSGGTLAAWLPSQLIKDEDQLRDFATRGGFSLLNGDSSWAAGFQSAKLSSATDAALITTTLASVRSHSLPTARSAISTAMAGAGLSFPETIETWDAILRMLTALATIIAVLPPEVFDLDLDEMAKAFAPAGSSSIGRAIGSMTNESFRNAKKTLEPLWLGSVPWNKKFEAVSMAAKVKSGWAFYGGVGHPSLPEGVDEATRALEELMRQLEVVAGAANEPGLVKLPIEDLIQRLDGYSEEVQLLEVIPTLRIQSDALVDHGLEALLRSMATDRLSPESAVRRLRFAWNASVFDEIQAADPRIAGFDPLAHSSAVDAFVEADRKHLAVAPQRIRRLVAERVIRVLEQVPEQASLVSAQVKKKRGGLAPRDLLKGAPDVLLALRPCWTMSPLEVARLLPQEQLFDVVIFDEASQVTPADAIGALSRGGRAIVAGDSKQLPPTTFFTSFGIEDEDEEDDEGLISGYESILDVMSGLLPAPVGTKVLNWHYRSRDERLIAFSNNQASLYHGSLVTFPGTSVDGAVRFVEAPPSALFSPDGLGSSEVAEIVRLVAEHAREKPEQSLGVISLGSKHAERIQEAIRRARVDDDELDAFVGSAEGPEPFFVKNLERVQGDQRDAIILSTGYTKGPDGRLRHNFGPINQEGGERRLNVAITRARNSMALVSSFSSADLDPTKLHSEGPQMLRRYFEYAESGGASLGTQAVPTVELNPFELDVLAQLTNAGMSLVPQYGVSGYRIDFAVAHPNRPGQMIMAVECDGAKYHSSPTARERDRLRQSHLENLGWEFHRIWSQTWFRHRENEVERALSHYRQVLASDSSLEERRQEPVEVNLAAPSSAPALFERGPLPIRVVSGAPITSYTGRQLELLVRWIDSDTLLKTRDETIRTAMEVLGYRRAGSRINDALGRAVDVVRRK